MLFKRSLLVCFILVLFMAPALWAQNQVTIRFAHPWTGGDPKAMYFREMIERFKRKHRDSINLILEETPGLDHRTKVLIDLSEGNPPDVFAYWGSDANLKPFVHADILVDAKTYLEKSETIQWSDYSESTWEFMKSGGRYQGVPVEAFQGTLLVNKELLENYGLKPPKTLEDWFTMAERLHKFGFTPFSMGSKRGDPGHLFFTALVYQFAGGIEDTRKLKETRNFSYSANLKAAQAIEQLRKNHVIPEDTMAIGDWGAHASLYNFRKAAMLYVFPWMHNLLSAEVVEQSVVIPIPKLPGGAVDPASFTVGGVSMGLFITKPAFHHPRKQTAVIQLADFIHSDEMHLAFMASGHIPAKIIKSQTEQLGQLSTLIQQVTPRPRIVAMHEAYFPNSDLFDHYKAAIDELYAGAISAEQFVEKVQSLLDRSQ